MPTNNTFHLAITMAGAVSAGAYTAGVIDYLLEVLDKWEEMKNDPEYADKVPKHNVVIEILSGASAGGMTACITSLVVQRERHPIAAYSPSETKSYDNLLAGELTLRKKNNRLYNSWVNMLDDEMIPRMLETNDLTDVSNNDEKTFVSGLNSKFIEKIAKENLVLKNPREPLKFPAYISENLRTFVTLTNLDGFKREINFAEGYKSGFFTYDHRDVTLFRFDGKDDTGDDGSIKVDFKTNENTDTFINAGMATGAFPIGLAYRTFSRNPKYIEDNILLKKLNGGKEVELSENDLNDKGDYETTFIDGGVINNEPFDLTEFLLEEQIKKQAVEPNTKNFKEFNSTVLMIDPFPSEEAKKLKIEKDKSPFSMIDAVAKLFSTVRTQSMLKIDEIEKALNKNNCSCFMLSPRRRITGEDPIDGSRAIACGSLGGFGGFLDKDFRQHDFYLGRINCKSFLQRHFVIPQTAAEENPIFSQSYGENNKEIRENFAYKNDKEEVFFPIIPDVNMLSDKRDDIRIRELYSNLTFPNYTEKEFEEKFSKYESGIKARLKMLVQSKINDYTLTAAIAELGFLWKGGKAFDAIYKVVKNELIAWKIIKK
jgi:Patatin-like phospholipase